jgi:hypothetical protein
MNHVDLNLQDAANAIGTNRNLGGDTNIQKNELNGSQRSEPAPKNVYSLSSDLDGICWGSGPWADHGVA